jgi:hypothetical protein
MDRGSLVARRRVPILRTHPLRSDTALLDQRKSVTNGNDDRCTRTARQPFHREREWHVRCRAETT